MKFTQIFLILMFFKTANVHTNGVQIDDSSKDKPSCEKDWDQFGEHCYKFEGGPSGPSLSWRGASARCSELGGHLASIHSEEENGFLLNSYGKEYGQCIWIGMHVSGDTSKYQWDDGSQTDFQNWALMDLAHFNVPPDIEDCSLLIYDFKFGIPGEWVSWHCERLEPYICKKKIQGKNVSVTEHPNIILDDDEFSTSTMKTTTPAKNQESTRSSHRMEIKTPENRGEITSTSNTFSVEIKTPGNQGDFTSTSNTCRNKNTALLSAFLIMLLFFILFR